MPWKIRLIFFAIGLTIGVLSSGIPGAVIYRNTVEQYNERMEMFEKLTSESIKSTAALREENEKLRTRKVERVNADGSSEIITEVDKDRRSSDETNTNEVAMLEHSISVLKEKQYLLKEEEERRSKWGLGLGINSHTDAVVYVRYGGPIYVFGFVNTNIPKYDAVIGVGVDF
jgi:hypothetical protein